MTVDITVPALGESVTEATVMRWNKAPGDAVAVDETLVELETDKIAVEVKAEAAGTLAEIAAVEGTDVEVGALLGRLETGEGAATAAAEPRVGEASDAPATVAARVTALEQYLLARRFLHLHPPCGVSSKSTASIQRRSKALARAAAS